MQRLSWDVIKARATEFAAEWATATYEKGETQSFYNDFFAIFGVKRRSVASYEKRVQTLDKSRAGFIDLFWPGQLLVEQKSGGLDLGKALGQALDYVDWLPDRDQPRYVLTCDFQKWRLHDLESDAVTVFTLPELHKHVEAFAFILGRQSTFTTQAEVNIKAAELMGRLHDALAAKGYAGHDLEKLLVRLLFCLFADDTGIFEPKDIFLQLIEFDTKADGSDTGRTLIELFDILDTPETGRMTGLSAELNAFPYVNGALFAGHVKTPVFDTAMRDMLLDAARFNWSKVSPAIFGSLFQSVMNAAERRAKGAHYTSETNILKVIEPLFLDDLRAELAAIKLRRTNRAAALQEFQNKLARLNFLDPACGCGNFLVIAYREIRALELECL
ncbi:MAG TPA: class I SAM-dependent DNA methyltransferase, partial [Polymorphobacter sp.]|nr:class I SAM-dependent DNA methyltransferase [Polymorphobacter sp.]